MKKKILTLLTITALVVTMGVSTLNAAQGKKSKPFLIQERLPHLTGTVKIIWDDKDLALTNEQKKKLMVVRKDTMMGAKSLNKKIIALENEIVKASQDGALPESLKNKVSALAALRAEATMVHLACIYNTRKILTKQQLSIVE
jgi:hypothetical protein